MDFKSFFEAEGAFAGSAPTDTPGTAPTSGAPSGGATYINPRLIYRAPIATNQEKNYFNQWGQARTADPKTARQYRNLAIDTGKYYQSTDPNKEKLWWQNTSNVYKTWPNADSDRFYRALQNSMRNGNFNNLYAKKNSSGRANDYGSYGDGDETHLEKIGRATRAADSYLGFASKSQQSNL